MRLLEDILVAIAGLIEAEIASVRRSLMRLAMGVGLLLASLVFVLAGVTVLAWAVYLLLTWALGSAISGAFLAAAFMLLVAAAVALYARRYTR